MVIILIPGTMYAQEKEALRIYLDIQCFQKEAEKDLRATVRARIGENKKILPVPDIPVDFYNVTDSSEVLLGTVSTDENGEAIYNIKGGMDLSLNPENSYSFVASFKGNEDFKKATSEVTIKEANIEIGFEEIDSTKVISAMAYEINPVNTERILLDGVNLSFYVPGSFSLYKIGEEELSEGKCTIDFPVTIPGDSLGNLMIIAKIEESDEYGNVEASAIKNWGLVREPVIPEPSRGLGDTDAPLWMVYTLIVLLSAVWIHYLYVFVVIYLIKKDHKTAT